MTDNRIVWEDPPPKQPRGVRSRWLGVIADLQAHPGKWARVANGMAEGKASSTASSSLKSRGCEATTRKQEDGTYAIYARWPEVAS